jgi:hypothetical protein
MTQKKAVEKHLKDCGIISSWQAIEQYGITRLSAFIYSLRKEGWNIESIHLSRTNRFENTSR